MLIVSSPSFADHVTPPGHPECMERAQVFTAAAARWMVKGGMVDAPRLATRGELEGVHHPDYLDRIERHAGRPERLDADTFTSSGSARAALLAAGAAVQAAEHALERHEPAFALVRPPGHHAESDRAMGFCIYNNVAVAAAAALARGIERVAIVDIDVHHGNGTQWMFYDQPRVLYVSTHQHPFYPGTGAAEDVGAREGKGFTLNVPLEAGATDADYDLIYRSAVLPILGQFAPQLLLISAGFDAHERDPLASMRVTVEGYARMVASLKSVGAPHGAIALVTEGGYDLAALRACIDATLSVLDGATPPPPERQIPAGTERAERALASVRRAQAPFWRGI